jgi:hypothetical protein
VTFFSRLGFGPRVTGPPTSSNGASSLHLGWEVPSNEPLVEVAVTLTVPVAPADDSLYFWALQANFEGGAGAHLGLQWGADAPRRMRHANWGGYAGHGGELTGTALAFPSSFGNPNTCDFDWSDGVGHRLRIARDNDGWAGFVDDMRLRSLHAGGATLHGPVVWSEVFADCDAPSVSVRWSDLEVVTAGGDHVPVLAVRTNYQTRADGGCDNTCSTVDSLAFVQTTNTARTTPQGARLSLP